MSFAPGDRVRWFADGDDGLPLVRYGFVGDEPLPSGEVKVVFDDELRARIVALERLVPVTITSVMLELHGGDLVSDPDLRKGLVHLWEAEAESAGLEVEAMRCLGLGVQESPMSWALAEVTSGGERYVVRAWYAMHDVEVIQVRAGSSAVAPW